MDYETLAQDIFNKESEVTKKEQELFLAKAELLKARAALMDKLCDANGPEYNALAISLRHHVLICEWDGEAEFELKFVQKAPNANT